MDPVVAFALGLFTPFVWLTIGGYTGRLEYRLANPHTRHYFNPVPWWPLVYLVGWPVYLPILIVLWLFRRRYEGGE